MAAVIDYPVTVAFDPATANNDSDLTATIAEGTVITSGYWVIVHALTTNDPDGSNVSIDVDGDLANGSSHPTGSYTDTITVPAGQISKINTQLAGGDELIATLTITQDLGFASQSVLSSVKLYITGDVPGPVAAQCATGWKRAMTDELAAHLDGECLTLAVCVKVERTDGEIFGFTSHDRDLLVDTVTYEALSSVQASALRQELGNGIDNLDVIGLIQSDNVSESDLRAGKFDLAEVELFLVNWADLTQGILGPLIAGTIGEIRIKDGQFIAEIRSRMQRLAQQIGTLTSPTCNVKELGDTDCKLSPMASYRFSKTVSAVTSRRAFTTGSTTQATHYFRYGKVTFTSGANEGFSREIKSHTNSSNTAVLEVNEPFPYDVAVSDTVELEAGCDRTFATCGTKFSNRVNFRGFPHVPGTDKIVKRGRPASQ